ncbi:MAG: lamin tail domain-containing protein [Candidatus Nealsonbacteria bacterium]|nr:lamin tail domain-containing protein [Candidatus Nealsonbacteria bacterium]
MSRPRKLSSVLLLLLSFPFGGLAANPPDVVFNEIAWMGTELSANKEWIELYNNTDNLIDLEGWQIRAVDGVPKVNLTGKVVARSFYLLERTNDDTVPEVSSQQIYTGALENNGEDLRLFDEKGNLVDEVRGEAGWPGGDNSTKQTLIREGSSWLTSSVPGGSPGVKNKALASTESDAGKQEPESTTVKAADLKETPSGKKRPASLALAAVGQSKALPSTAPIIKRQISSPLGALGLPLFLGALSGIIVLMLKVVKDKERS